jgi:hypothetical protein
VLLVSGALTIDALYLPSAIIPLTELLHILTRSIGESEGPIISETSNEFDCDITGAVGLLAAIERGSMIVSAVDCGVALVHISERDAVGLTLVQESGIRRLVAVAFFACPVEVEGSVAGVLVGDRANLVAFIILALIIVGIVSAIMADRGGILVAPVRVVNSDFFRVDVRVDG